MGIEGHLAVRRRPTAYVGMLASTVASVAALAATAGCDGVANTRVDYSTTEKVAVTTILITGGSGDVTIRGGGTAGEVRIDRVVRYRGDEPGRTYRINGSELEIDTECGNFCTVSYDIRTPDGVSVRGHNGSGDLNLADVAAVDVELGSGTVTVQDSSADVSVDAGSGDVTVTSVAGTLTAKTGSGSIDASGVMGGRASVEAGSGDITLTVGSPADVRGEVGSGDLTVTVPATGTYRVDASTGSGEETIGVPNIPTGEHLLELNSGSGDITVRADASARGVGTGAPSPAGTPTPSGTPAAR